MKVIKIKKASIIKFITLILFLVIVSTLTTSFGMQHYYNLDFVTGLVTASTLNVRSGPGTKYPVIA